MMWRMHAVAHAGMIQYICASSWFGVSADWVLGLRGGGTPDAGR